MGLLQLRVTLLLTRAAPTTTTSASPNVRQPLDQGGIMTTKVKPIPEGYHTATPYLIVQGAANALEFYKRAFGARELFRFPDGDKIGHAEIQIGDSRLMLADEYPEMGARSPQAIGGSPVSIMLYVENVDAVVKQ